MGTDNASCWKCKGHGVILIEEGPAGATYSFGYLCSYCKGTGRDPHKITQDAPSDERTRR